MNGRLWSDAEPGKGTRISFRLPYHGEEFDRR
jgi:signal transduction histidine kinase